MSRCRNCGFDLDRKDEFDEDDEDAADVVASGAGHESADSEAPVAAGGADVAAQGSSGVTPPPPSVKPSEEPTTPSPKKRLSWDDTFRQIRKGKRV